MNIVYRIVVWLQNICELFLSENGVKYWDAKTKKRKNMYTFILQLSLMNGNFLNTPDSVD